MFVIKKGLTDIALAILHHITTNELFQVESEGRFLIYTVEVLPEGCSNSNIVKVLHMTSWPDRGLPMSGRHVLRLIRQVNGDKLDNGPIVMHCSAGIGRTGTIILIDVILRRLFSAREVDVCQNFQFTFPSYERSPGWFSDGRPIQTTSKP
ncbi:Protein-tyrosine phosphatase, partial [Cooperia oncophora]